MRKIVVFALAAILAVGITAHYGSTEAAALAEGDVEFLCHNMPLFEFANEHGISVEEVRRRFNLDENDWWIHWCGPDTCTKSDSRFYASNDMHTGQGHAGTHGSDFPVLACTSG